MTAWRIAKALGILGLAAAALAVLLVLALQLSPARSMLAGVITGLASNDGERIEIAGISGFLPFDIAVGRVRIADADGEWLVLDDLKVDWSPLALLAGRIDIAHVDVGAIRVARRPLPKTKSGSDSTLDFDIDVGRVDLRKIELAEPVAGVAAAFAGYGGLHFADGGADLAAALHLERTDGAGGRLDVTLDADPKADRLVLDAHLAEPAGGVAAGLLRLAAAPALALDVSGTGTLDDFGGKLRLVADDRPILAGNVSLKPAGDRRRLQANLAGSLDGLLPQAIADLLAGNLALALDAGLPTVGGLDLDRLHFSARNVALDASGRLSAEGGERLAASLVLAAPDDRPIRLGLADGGTAAIGGLRVDLTAEPGKGGGTAWRARLDGNGLATAAARAGGLALTASGTAGPSLAVMEKTDLALDLVAAEPFAAGRTLGETVRARLAGNLALTGGATEIALKGSASGIATGTAAIDGLLGESIALALELTAGDGLAIDVLSAENSAFSLSLAGSAGDELDLAAKARINDLARLQPQASGAVDLSADITGTATAPELAAEIAASEVRLAGHAFTKGLVEVSARLPGPVGNLRLSGALDGKPVTGTATILADGKTGGSRANLDFRLLAARLAGDLAIGASGDIVGPVDLSVPDLAEIAPLVLIDLAGALSARAEFSAGEGGQTIALAANAKRLRAATTEIGSAELSGVIADAFATPAAKGTLSAKAVRAGGQRIDSLNVTARPADAGTALDIAATLPEGRANATATVAAVDAGTEIRLSALDARWKGVPVKLTRPARLVSGGGVTTIDTLALDVSGGSLNISGRAGDSLALDIAARSLPATLLDVVDPKLGAAGRITADARVTGTPAAPRVDWTLDWRDASLAEVRALGLAALALSGKGTLAGPRTSLDMKIAGAGLDIAVRGNAPAAATEPLALRVTGKVPLALANGQLGDRGARASGEAALDLDISGRLPTPSVSGRISTANAGFSDPGSGISASGIAAVLRLAGDNVSIEKLDGSIGKNGTFTASGKVGIAPGSLYPADLSIAIRNGRYTDGSVVAARFSADLGINGPLLGQATARGKVDLEQVDITIPDKLPASVAVLNVEHRNAPEAVEAQARRIEGPKREGGNATGLGLDIAVNAPGRIFVRGRGLDAELGGSIRLRGTTAAPYADGGFEMRRGRLSLLGKRLAFSRGTVDFSGDFDPYLDFAATTSTSDTTIEVLVAGRASDPQFTFNSSPSLPQEEVLALLVFGRTTDKLSPAQIATLASSIAELGGLAGSGPGLLGRLRQGLGVDDLEVAGDGEGGAAVKAGRYVTDKVYLGVSQGTSADTSKVTVDLDVTKNIKARGEVGSGGKSKVGVTVEWDY
ncbi:MAG: translocation/assembly module TamB domain-containing protein [Hyphomicrobiales bacterium]